MSIIREIKVTSKGLDFRISITYGTDMLPVELKVTDYIIPKYATAVVYSEGRNGEIKKQLCEIRDNAIVFTPKAGFFEEGVNILQARVVYNNQSLFAFAGTVSCEKSYSDDDAKEVESQPTLIEQVLTELGEIKENGGGATSEQLAQIEKNKQDIAEISSTIDDKITSPTSAKVGQILSVVEVDENGKPTKWQPVDKPSGGIGVEQKVLKILDAAVKFDCTTLGVNADNDTALIKEVLAYAKENGYNYILFPEKTTWLLQPTKDNKYSIFLPTNTIIDLNGSTLKVNPHFNYYFYYLMRPEEGAENTVLCNGVVEGDRESNTAIDTNHSENTTIFHLTGKNCSLKEMVFKNTLGDGINIGSYAIKSTIIKGSDLFGCYSYETGSQVANEYRLSTVDLLTLADYYTGVGAFCVSPFYTVALENETHYMRPHNSLYTVYFYDSESVLINSYTQRTESFISKDMIPTNAVYFRIEFLMCGKMSGFTGNLYIKELNVSENCFVENVQVINARRNGITIEIAKYATLKDVYIDSTKGASPQRAIDIEPSVGIAENITLKNVRTTNNETGGLASTLCYGLHIDNCEFYENISTSGTYNLVAERNHFFGSVQFNGGMNENYFNETLMIFPDEVRNNVFIGTSIVKNNTGHGFVCSGHVHNNLFVGYKQLSGYTGVFKNNKVEYHGLPNQLRLQFRTIEDNIFDLDIGIMLSCLNFSRNKYDGKRITLDVLLPSAGNGYLKIDSNEVRFIDTDGQGGFYCLNAPVYTSYFLENNKFIYDVQPTYKLFRKSGSVVVPDNKIVAINNYSNLDVNMVDCTEWNTKELFAFANTNLSILNSPTTE